ncbi:hypothetical protein JKP75_09730 [Blastococcus sp. TML/M2B]|uniref:putative PEP-binding protein n=1 Tax=unclassified Blastococcus TaxID=2619396 RepID=UPI00190A9A80|nr:MULTISPECIES: putative PEP-binding protein [unclassified Blastococcus]MBN1092812.1 hypothetical protein [Blastococcus sp. TML/M2B]MBN1097081.1 hypothetical protein [Blastococcus sp. TML/C7B]
MRCGSRRAWCSRDRESETRPSSRASECASTACTASCAYWSGPTSSVGRGKPICRPSPARSLLTRALRGQHPSALIAAGESEQVVSDLAASIGTIAGAFAPRPVTYRAADLRSNEFRGLTGGDVYEPVEDNPMIGYRGCYRYVHDPSFFRLELAALARVREEFPAVGLMIPFVRTKWELEACLQLVDDSPLGRQRGLRPG